MGPEYEGPVEVQKLRDGVHLVRPAQPAAPVSIPADDEYGECLGDWEDPYGHDSCTGCDMCRPWEGRTYEVIRAERRAYVAQLRAGGTR